MTATPIHILGDIGSRVMRFAALPCDTDTFETPFTRSTPQRFSDALETLYTLLPDLTRGRNVVSVTLGIRGALGAGRKALAADSELTQWVGLPLQTTLARVFNAPVTLYESPVLAALGEAHYGAGKQFTHFTFHQLGATLSGVHIHDAVCEPHIGFERGILLDPIAHEAVFTNALAHHLSGSAIERRTGLPAYEHTPESTIFTHGAEYLAQGVVSVLEGFQPEAVILSGPMITGTPAISLPQTILHVERIIGETHAPILQATLGAHAALYGAAVTLL